MTRRAGFGDVGGNILRVNLNFDCLIMLTRGQTARNTETTERLSLGDQMESDNGGRVSIDDNRSSWGSKTGSENGRKDEVREETIS